MLRERRRDPLTTARSLSLSRCVSSPRLSTLTTECLGPFVAFFLTPADKVQRTDGSKVELPVKRSTWQEIKEISKLFITPKVSPRCQLGLISRVFCSSPSAHTALSPYRISGRTSPCTFLSDLEPSPPWSRRWSKSWATWSRVSSSTGSDSA